VSNLTAIQIDEELNVLIESLDVGKRQIPPVSVLLKRSLAIPLLALMLSLVSTVVFYLASYKDEATVTGFIEFFLSEGWYLIGITLVVGFLVFFMTYNNQLIYMTLPKEVRDNSLIFCHLSAVVRRILTIFILLMSVSCAMSAFSAWFAISIPVLLLVMFVVTGIVVSSEINRLGAGVALEKVSALLKKI